MVGVDAGEDEEDEVVDEGDGAEDGSNESNSALEVHVSDRA